LQVVFISSDIKKETIANEPFTEKKPKKVLVAKKQQYTHTEQTAHYKNIPSKFPIEKYFERNNALFLAPTTPNAKEQKFAQAFVSINNLKNWTKNKTKNTLSFAHQSPKELHPSINIYKNRPPPFTA
jgi:hypothetical protein